MTITFRPYTLMLVSLLAAGCATVPPDVVGAGTQLEIRQMQTREYDTLDKQMTLRSVISTLQDLGFLIDKADLSLGTITATRLHQYQMRMTITVREKGESRVAVRVSARIGEKNVANPKTYQDFFVALDKAMFLTLHKVD